MSLHDAIKHIIVECDYDKIHVALLEFLMRITFAWKHHKRELVGEHPDEDDNEPKPMAWGEQKPKLNLSGSKLGSNLMQLMFDEEIFKQGMTAADFQEELTRITMLPRTDVEELL